MAHHSRDKHIEGHSYLYHSKNRNLFFLLKNPNIQCFLSFPSILTWSLGQSSAFREGCFPEEGGYLLSLKENTNVIWNLLMIKYEMRWLFGWITNVGELLIFTQRPPKMTMLRVLQMRINELFSSFFFLILSFFLRTCRCYLLVKPYTLFFSDVPLLCIWSSSAQMNKKHFPYQSLINFTW